MIKVDDRVVFKWLGTEYIGVVKDIIKQDKEKRYLIEYENSIYRCYDSSRFGTLLLDKTEDLQNNEYVRVTKTNADIMIEEIEEMLNQIKEYNEKDYPKRKMKEFKLLIVDFRKKLSELQKEVLSK